MQNEIIINAALGETRVALLENGQFAELHIERARDKSVVGNVVKGRVMRVLPGMQAAFVDIGLEKAAFLYVGDYFESVLETGETDGEPGSGGRRRGRGRGGRSAPPRIDTVLHEGKEIVVQIAKEPIGTKGARITSSISIPGRHLVLTPWSRRVGVSRASARTRSGGGCARSSSACAPRTSASSSAPPATACARPTSRPTSATSRTVWAADPAAHRRDRRCPRRPLLRARSAPAHRARLRGHDTKRIVTDDKQVYESIQASSTASSPSPSPQIEHYDENGCRSSTASTSRIADPRQPRAQGLAARAAARS